MSNDELNLLVDKLNLQVKSFQEGFEVLSQARNLNDLAKHFSHILRGNLLTLNVNIFYLEKDEENWVELYVHDQKSFDQVKHFKADLLPKIEFLEHDVFKVVITLPLIDKNFFGLIIGGKIDKKAYSELDKISIQIFMQLLGNAYQAFINQKKEKELLFSLNNKVLQLNSLIDTGIELSSIHNTDSLLDLALERSVVLTNASAGGVFIEKEGKSIQELTFPPGLDKEYLDNSENKLKTKFSLLEKDYSFILIEKESRTGVVEFDDTDEILLGAFARQLQSAIENEHLHKEALETENIKKELSVASEIQKKIIPESLPEIEGYNIAGTNIPSKEVGGDYYDCLKLNDGRYALIMADVAGKGVPASLLVSTLNASLNAYLDLQVPLEQLATKINSIIYNSSPSNKFITFFISILNPATGELDVVNAGHNPSLLLRKNKTLVKIEAGGVAFGMFDMGLPFAGEQLVMEKGDRLLLFTDGIPEAMNHEEEEYSDERLEEFFCNNLPESAEKFISNLVKDVRKHTGSTPQSDDITALYLIRS
jgi:sigma-B regulation protein RsbU (phosphoserine phosphatase)